ncbi:hypothetical protein [Haloimpatiens massiliensis]|uniref:hypothetical protein n=1 Tax=Haloimpatiens massiliensis TaxID=1658110 RepID=UPI000C82DE30|nr:hypothetical protein [Haloimpatiens massiliensis]
MAYQKTTWKNRLVERPGTYTFRQNADGTVTLLAAEGNVIEAGTPVNAENMNKIENFLEELDKRKIKESDITEAVQEYTVVSSVREQGYRLFPPGPDGKRLLIQFGSIKVAESEGANSSSGGVYYKMVTNLTLPLSYKDENFKVSTNARGAFCWTFGSSVNNSQINIGLSNVTNAATNGNQTIQWRTIGFI